MNPYSSIGATMRLYKKSSGASFEKVFVSVVISGGTSSNTLKNKYQKVLDQKEAAKREIQFNVLLTLDNLTILN